MINKLSIPLKYIAKHPLTKEHKWSGFYRFFIWQFKSRLGTGPIIINWLGNLKLSVSKSMHGATGCIYVGLPEFRDMAFLLHFLNPESLFIDIGANIGAYSLLAAGKNNAKTISIEPIPQTFNFLEKNINLNRLENHVSCLNIGLSNQKGELYFTKDKDTVNHVVENKSKNTVTVKVNTLDNILDEKINTDTLIKLDVEGFELNVLNGSGKTLQNKHLKAIIVELNGSSKRYGLDDSMVDEILMTNGFNKYDYNPFNRQLNPLDMFHEEENTLYIKSSEVEYVKQQIKKSPPFQVLNKSI
jgi:FkbM family methyltransferase